MKASKFLFSTLATLFFLPSAWADMSWHCHDNKTRSSTVVDVRFLHTGEALGSASWDGPGDSGGHLSDWTLQDDSNSKGLHFDLSTPEGAFDLTIQAPDSPVAGKTYKGQFSGTQKNLASTYGDVSCIFRDPDSLVQ